MALLLALLMYEQIYIVRPRSNAARAVCTLSKPACHSDPQLHWSICMLALPVLTRALRPQPPLQPCQLAFQWPRNSAGEFRLPVIQLIIQ
jgi:hypothetical protein